MSGRGEFDGFETSTIGEERTSDEALTIRALDLTKAGSDSILGRKLNLVELLPSELKDVSAAITMGNFEHVANSPAEEIARAREDATNSLAMALNLYEANRCNYGYGAFGLRLAHWIAHKAPDTLLDSMTLVMFRLRHVPGAILPSDEIAEMTQQVAKSHEQDCQSQRVHPWYNPIACRLRCAHMPRRLCRRTTRGRKRSVKVSLRRLPKRTTNRFENRQDCRQPRL